MTALEGYPQEYFAMMTDQASVRRLHSGHDGNNGIDAKVGAAATQRTFCEVLPVSCPMPKPLRLDRVHKAQ
jgi:hypothetical protein